MTESKDRELRVILDNTAPANDAIEPTSRFERALDSQSIDFDREKVTNEDDGTTEYRYFLDEGSQQGKARQLARQNVGKSEHVRRVRYIRHNEDHPPSTENATETGNPAEDDIIKPTFKAIVEATTTHS